ncbi:hypothetical protein KIPB_005283, partial [Kipferlia bialata]
SPSHRAREWAGSPNVFVSGRGAAFDANTLLVHSDDGTLLVNIGAEVLDPALGFNGLVGPAHCFNGLVALPTVEEKEETEGDSEGEREREGERETYGVEDSDTLSYAERESEGERESDPLMALGQTRLPPRRQRVLISSEPERGGYSDTEYSD